MLLDDCRPFPHALELQLRTFGVGRRGARAGPTAERVVPTMAPAEPPGGQAAAKVGVAA